MVRVRALLVALALTGMLCMPALILARIYSGDLLPRLLVGAAIGSVALSMISRRLPSWAVAPLSLLGLTGYSLVAVKLSAASAGVPGQLSTLTSDALRNGIPRLLTALIPIEPQPDTVIVPVVALWLAGLASAELALRGAAVLPAYVPPTLLYAGALVLVGPNARASVTPALGFVGCAVLGLAASTGRSGRPANSGQQLGVRLRVGAAAGVGLATVVALAAAVGPLVAVRVEQAPTDPRRYVVPPQLDALDENPLVRLSGWALTPNQHLLDARLSGVRGSTRIRLAVLGDYDGVTWRAGATYRGAGRVLPEPAALAAGARGHPIEQQITIGELDGRLLPAVATPRRVDGVRVAWDPDSATLSLPDGLRPGLAYTVLSQAPEVDVNVLPGADVPAGPAVARFLSLGSQVPPEMSRLAAQLGEGSAAPYQRALAIEQFLAEHYQLVGDAPSGHAFPNLNFFLFGARNTGGQRGTTEQFAASFAVLGRVLGLPTRVVVGFSAGPGATTVRAADAFAWPEVLFDGIGWVAFDPLPQPNIAPRAVEDDFRPKPATSNPPPSSVAPPTVPGTPPAPPTTHPPTAEPPVAADRRPLLMTAGGVTAGAGLAYALAIPLLRTTQRRRRLYRGDPAQRIAGAWREVLDGLRLAGRPAPAHLAAQEVAGHAAFAASSQGHARIRRAAPTPAPSVHELARLANAVAFAPPPAPTTAPSDAEHEAARHAVAQALSYVDQLRMRRSRWRRLMWRMDPRPLFWHVR